jgi:hypothetical protein
MLTIFLFILKINRILRVKQGVNLIVKKTAPTLQWNGLMYFIQPLLN